MIIFLCVFLIKAALVEELYLRRELFPGEQKAFMDLSQEEARAQAERLAGAIAFRSSFLKDLMFELTLNMLLSVSGNIVCAREARQST